MGLLKQNVELENGLIAPQVYYKITKFWGDKDIIYYTLSAYASRDAFQLGSPELFQYGYALPYTEGDILVIGYKGLKEREEFADAIDILEDIKG